jgi:sarcosine oxidase subunit beta
MRGSVDRGASTADVAVVGAGIVGVLSAWRLRSAGYRVLLLCDRHLGGGTSASAAVIRTTCDEPVLAARSLAWYRDWNAAQPPALAAFTAAGVAVVTAPGLHAVARSAAAAAGAVHPWAAAQPAGVSLLPDGYLLHGDELWCEPQAGYADPRLTVLSLIAAFLRAGGSLLREPVRSLRRAERRAWWLRTSQQEITCGRVLVAAGASTAALLPDRAARLPLRRQPVHMGRLTVPAPCPAAIVDLAQGVLLRPERPGLLAGARVTGGGAEHRRALQRRLRARLPRLGSVVPAAGPRSEFDLTADGSPYVGAVDAGLYVACGFAGGGFKLAPAITEDLAELIVSGRATPALRRLDPLRGRVPVPTAWAALT